MKFTQPELKPPGFLKSIQLEFLTPGRSKVVTLNRVASLTMTLGCDETISNLTVTLPNAKTLAELLLKESYKNRGLETSDLLVSGVSQSSAGDSKSFSTAVKKPMNEVAGNVQESAKIILEECAAIGITSKIQAAFIIGTARHETGEFSLVKEQTTGDEYEYRYDIGNDAPGDGRKYIGRGYIQTTGKANYKQVGEFTSLPLLDNPDLLCNDARVAAKVIVYCIHNLFAVTGNESAHAIYKQGDSLLESVGDPLSSGFDSTWEGMSKIVNVYGAVNGGQALIDVIEKYKDSYQRLASGDWVLPSSGTTTPPPAKTLPTAPDVKKLEKTETASKPSVNVDSKTQPSTLSDNLKGSVCRLSFNFLNAEKKFIFVHSGTEYDYQSNTLTLVFFASRIMAAASPRLNLIPTQNQSFESLMRSLAGLEITSNTPETSKNLSNNSSSDILMSDESPLKTVNTEANKKGLMVVDDLATGFTTLKDLTLPRDIWTITSYINVKIADKSRGETPYQTRSNDKILQESQAPSSTTQVKAPTDSKKLETTESPGKEKSEDKQTSLQPTTVDSLRKLTLVRAYETEIVLPFSYGALNIKPGDGCRIKGYPIEETLTVASVTYSVPGNVTLSAYVPVMGKNMVDSTKKELDANPASSGNNNLFSNNNFNWPVKGDDARVLMAYGEYDPISFAGYRCNENGCSPHKGLDITCGADKTLYAVCDGTITTIIGVEAGDGAGLYFVLTCGFDDLAFYYFHCKEISVAVGDEVKAGQPCGVEGYSAFGSIDYHQVHGTPGTPHLHFEVRNKVGDQTCNPRDFFRDKGISWQPKNLNTGGHTAPPNYLGVGVPAKRSW